METSELQKLTADLTALAGIEARDLGAGDITALRRLFEDDRYGLYLFASLIFGLRLKPEIHLPICQFYSRWGQSVLADGSIITTPPSGYDQVTDSWRRLMLRVPRDTLKTSVCTRAGSLWTLARDPNHDETILIVNEKAENAQRWTGAVARVVESNYLFQTLWREMIPKGIGYWDRDKGVTRPRNWKWGDTGLLFERNNMNLPELSIEPHGVGSAITGKHFTRKVLDDIIGEEAQKSQMVMESVIHWVDNSRPLESPAENGCELVVHTPKGYADVYAHMLKKWTGEYKIHVRHQLEDANGQPDHVNGESIWPEKLSTAKCHRMMSAGAKGFYFFMCLPGETLITNSDWTETPIEFCHPGQEIIGFELGDKIYRTGLVNAKIVHVHKTSAEVFEYTLEDGEVIRCTEDHKWYSGRLAAGRPAYGPLGSLKHSEQRRVCRAYKPLSENLTTEQLMAAAYLGGMFDADGSMSRNYASGRRQGVNGSIVVAVQHRTMHPEVNERIRHCLKLLDFEWTEHHAGSCFQFVLKGGKQARYRFIRLCRPSKSLNQLYRTLMLTTCEKIKVVSRRSLGVQFVYGLETTTGNYLADGYMSKNSEYQCIPRAGTDQSFDDGWFHYGQMLEASDGEPLFRIDSAHYEPGRFDPSSGDSTAPNFIPLSWMDKCLVFDTAPSRDSAIKKEPHSDNALVLVGKDPWNRRYLLDAWSGRDGPVEILHKLMSMLQRWSCSRVAVEEVAMSAWVRPLFEQIIRHQYDWLPSFQPVRPKGRQKEERIRALVGPVQSGFWYFNRPTCSQVVIQLGEFPYGQKNDLIDAMSYTDEVTQPPESPDQMRRRWYQERHQDRGDTGYGVFY